MKTEAKAATGLALLLLAAVALGADGPAAKAPPVSVPSRTFRIPFRIDEGNRQRVETITLFVSRDEGKSWRQAGTITPGEPGFTFSPTEDGVHWFAAQTVTKHGRKDPGAIGGLTPTLIVVFEGGNPLTHKAPGPDAVPKEAYESLRKEVEHLRRRLEALERKLAGKE